MNPKNSVLDWVFCSGVFVVLVCGSSMNSSDDGIFICLFGILTTPRFWSSRMSIMSGFFLLLNSILLLGWIGI